MLQEKVSLILDEGIDVSIIRNPNLNTRAIIGRITETSSDFFALENQRKGLFLPTVNLLNGEVVENLAVNEFYLTISVINEVSENEIISNAALLLKCNSVLQLTTVTQKADAKGNITTLVNNVLTTKAYSQLITDKLRQLDMGILSDATCRVYVPADPAIKLNSQILLNEQKHKVIGIDKTSYERVYVLQLNGDVRNL